MRRIDLFRVVPSQRQARESAPIDMLNFLPFKHSPEHVVQLFFKEARSITTKP